MARSIRLLRPKQWDGLHRYVFTDFAHARTWLLQPFVANGRFDNIRGEGYGLVEWSSGITEQITDKIDADAAEPQRYEDGSIALTHDEVDASFDGVHDDDSRDVSQSTASEPKPKGGFFQ